MGCSPSVPELQPHFLPIRKIGRGTFAEVWLCENGVTKKEVAVKLIRRGFDEFDARHISFEIQLQALVTSSYVVRLNQLFLTKQYLGLVLEYVPGGTLDRFCIQHPPDEEMACFLLRQLVACVDFLHCHQVAHRDLKMNNVLVSRMEDGVPRLKLIDFGCAKRWKRRDQKQGFFCTSVGTPAYMTPQLLVAAMSGGRKAYDGAKVDVWTLGIMLVQMFAGPMNVPYSMNNYVMGPMSNEQMAMTERLRDMQKGEWQKSSPAISAAVAKMSPGLIDLINSILDPMESTRIGLAGITDHPWCQQELSQAHKVALELILAEGRQLPLNPMMIADHVDMDISLPSPDTGRYQKVDDIVAMAAKGRYVPRSPEGQTGPMWLLNMNDIQTSMDISVRDGMTCDGRTPSQAKLSGPTVRELTEKLTEADPSLRDCAAAADTELAAGRGEGTTDV